MKKLLFIVNILAATHCFSQEEFNGSVKSKERNEPIPYVNITKTNKQEGTYSDESGAFKIKISLNESLTFSSIGYKTVTLTYNEIKSNNNQVFLEEDIAELESVTIKSSRGRVKSEVETFGFSDSKKKSRLVTKTPGFQVSTLIENPRKTEGNLESILLNIVSSGKSSHRIHLPSLFTKQGIGNELTNKNIIVDIGRQKGVFKIDLTTYEILLPKDGLIVGVEFLGNIGQNNKLVIINGSELNTKLFLSQGDSQRNTWIGFMGKGYEREIYSQIYNTNCNAMIGIRARFYNDD